MNREIVCFEGIDGCGKSTCFARLKEKADEQDVIFVDKSLPRPIRTCYATLVAGDAQFPSEFVSLCLGLADYVHTYEHLPEGSALPVWDRYAYSALADAIALGVQPQFVLELARAVPPAAVTIFVDLEPRVALARKQALSLAEAGGPEFVSRHGSLEAGFLAFQSQVRRGYHLLLEAGLLGTQVHVLDGRDEPSVLAAKAWSIFRTVAPRELAPC